MKKVLCGCLIAALFGVSPTFAGEKNVRDASSKMRAMKSSKIQNAGTYRVHADGSTTKVKEGNGPRPMADFDLFNNTGQDANTYTNVGPITWLDEFTQETNVWYDVVPHEATVPPYEYVSRNQAAVAGATITGMDVFFVTTLGGDGAVDGVDGTITLELRIYDGNTFDETHSALAGGIQLEIDLDKPADTPNAAYGYGVTLMLDTPFVLPGTDFEMGLVWVSGVDANSNPVDEEFGPILTEATAASAAYVFRENIPGPGTTNNMFEVWWEGLDGGDGTQDAVDSLKSPDANFSWWFGADGPYGGMLRLITDTPLPNKYTYVYQNHYTGGGATKMDQFKFPFIGTGNPPFESLTNGDEGITGFGVDRDFPGLPAVSLADFTFEWSQQGLFGSPTWTAAPAPTLTYNEDLGQDGRDQALFTWPDDTIRNRWLRVTVLATDATGLTENEVFYIGHLQGETTGLEAGAYSVQFADIPPVRNASGNTADAGDPTDIDQNGLVQFADVSAVRVGIGAQLSDITIP